MENGRKLPVGLQSFEKIRKEKYAYVDKTEYIWQMVQSGEMYFLSRPRRFGKSLLVSTLEAYFEGHQDLFQGLYIEQKENEKGKDAWLQYPVIHFSLSGGDYHEKNGLADRLNGVIESCCQHYELTGRFAIYGETLALRFKTLIEQLYAKTGRPVVVLVDEYDKPLLETMIVNEKQEEQNRRMYKGFFSILKDEDQYLKFVFFTGVTKFGQVSVFSDLNQLRDISLSDDYAGICGITEDELERNFPDEIKQLSMKKKISAEVCRKKLIEMYDGYHFSAQGVGVYNPFSLLSAFQDGDFKSYWFATGTPTFLINKLRKSSFTPEQFAEGVQATEMSITDYRGDNPDPIPLFYQAGYLTICGWNERFRVYSLKFPDNEVKYGFLNSLFPYEMGREASETSFYLMNFIEDLENGDTESFIRRLEALFASIPYPEGMAPKYEREWRNQIYLVFALMGQNVACEVHTTSGRADCIVKTENYIYIFELKLDCSAREALEQIRDKGYAEPYEADPQKVILIGVNFSSEKRNVSEYLIEEI